VLSTSVYLLNRYTTDAHQREHIAKLKTQIDRLGKMIKDMLTMSRLDKPVEDEFEFEQADLSALVSRVVSDHRGLAESKQQRLVYAAENLVPPLRADPAKLEQAIANLIENAIKYTPSGGLVSVMTGVRDARAFVRVSDSGPGIDPRDQPHIFERFYRGKAHRPSEGGTGLGLSIVQKIIALHGGVIEVESVLGHGATFTVWLPLS
jgi:signal transduction histidine kinase